MIMGIPRKRFGALTANGHLAQPRRNFIILALNEEMQNISKRLPMKIGILLALRLFGSHAGWDWNYEGVYQTGSFGNLTINAWTVASITGFTFNALKWMPRLALSANIASGDNNPNDKELNTFNPLYPNLSYFEEAAILAPQNFFNLDPNLSIQPLESVRFSVDWNFFWRLSKNDAVYVRGLNPLTQTLGVGGHFVTHAPTVNMDWQINKHLGLGLSVQPFFCRTSNQSSWGKRYRLF